MSNFMDLQQVFTNGHKAEILKKLEENLSNDVEGDKLLQLAFVNDNLSQEGLIDILGIFLNRGIIDINYKDKLGKTILHLAVERRMRDVIDFCLRRNANTNPRNELCNSIAHFAVEEECRKLHSASRMSESLEIESSSFIDWMVSRGFDFFYKRNAQNISPLYLANDLNLQHVLLTLLKRIDDLPAAEKNQTPLLRAYLENNYTGDRSRRANPTILNPINSSYYSSRHVYNIVKIILEKSKCIDDKVLNKALRSAIESKEKIYVIELLAQRMQNVDLRSRYELSLVETFARSFETSWASPSSYNYNDKMAILRTLLLKGTHLHTYINERDGRSTLAEKLFLTHPTMKMLEILKECRVDFSKRNSCGGNFLHLVSLYGSEAGMIDLIWNKVSRDVNVADNIRQTPLVIAVKCRNQFAAIELIERRAKINVTDCDGRSLLVFACEWARIKVLEKLIDYGADLNYRDEDGKTLLHLTLHEKEVIELLLKNNLDVNARDDSGRTPLEFALTSWKLFRKCRIPCMLGDVEALKKLIERGARLDYRDEDNKTLLHYAVSDWRMVEILLKNGLDVNAKDINGKTPLQVAMSDAFVNGASVIEEGQAEVWEKLIEYGADAADLDYIDKDGKTRLHLAVNNPKLTELLLKRGLNVNARDKTGKTPLHFATTDEVVKVLLNSGALVDTMDEDGNTPLHDALCREECQSIDELIKNGADIWDSKVFNLALKYFKGRFTTYTPLKLRYLKRHLIKMTVVGLLDKMPKAPYGIENELEAFIEQCKKEVELLKNFPIDDGTSLYELLRKNRNRKCAFVDNEKLKNLVNDEEIETKFRIYSALIRGCYNEAARRKPLLESGIDIMNKLSRKNMRVFCIDLIFRDLSNVDMMRFIEACENLTVNNTASVHRPKLTVVNIAKLLKKER